LTDLKTRRAAC